MKCEEVSWEELLGLVLELGERDPIGTRDLLRAHKKRLGASTIPIRLRSGKTGK